MADVQAIVHNAIRASIEHELGGRLAGYAFVLTRGGQPLAEVCDGWARTPWEDVDPSVPFTPDTRAFIASLSKPITLAGILRMISDWNYVVGFIPHTVLARGWQAQLKRELLATRPAAAALPSALIDAAFAHRSAISLDEPVLTFIRSRLTQTPSSGTDQITLRNIAGHRSGLDIGEDDSFPTGSEAELWQSISATFAKPMLANGPGVAGQPGYRNQHYSILRGVLDTVTGEDYETYLGRTVLRPAGAPNATTQVEDDARPTVYYSLDAVSGRVAAQPGFTFGDAGWGAGPDGWYASARELSAFWLAFHDGALVGLDESAVQDLFHRGDSGIASYDEQTVTLYGHEGHYGLFDGSGRGGVFSGLAGVTDDGLVAVMLLNGDDAGDWGYSAFAAAVDGVLPVVSIATRYHPGGVTISNVLGTGTVRYTLDGSEPTASSTAYSGSFEVAAGTTIKAAVFDGSTPLTPARRATADHDTPGSMPSTVTPSGNTGLAWTAAAGSWERVWPVASADATVKGESSDSSFDLAAVAAAVGSGGTNFAVEYHGILNLGNNGGTYTFKLTSDDGSRLWIDDVLVIDNDGLHAPQTVQQDVLLAGPGHRIRLQFLQGGGGSELDLSWSGPGFGETSLGPASFLH